MLVAEYSTESNPTPRVAYLTADHLGSPRIVTDQNGAVVSRHDYTGFGRDVAETLGSIGGRTSQQGYGANDEVRKQYTGYEHDNESGLEYAQARYYNAAHGRFTSADPLMASANVKNPQTLNRYSYVLNSPYKFTDPLGLISRSTAACAEDCPNGEGNLLGGGGGGYQDGTENFAEQKAAPAETPPSSDDGTFDAQNVTPTVGLYSQNGVNGDGELGGRVAVFDSSLTEAATAVAVTAEQYKVAYELNKENALRESKQFNDAIDDLSPFEIKDWTADPPFGSGRFSGAVTADGTVIVPGGHTGGSLGVNGGWASGTGDALTINNDAAIASANKANAQIRVLNDMTNDVKSLGREKFVAANKNKFVTIRLGGRTLGRERIGADSAGILYNNAVRTGLDAARAQLLRR